MKAVIYHAEGRPLFVYPPRMYEKLFAGFIKNTRNVVDDVIHLTLAGHPGWGTLNYHFPPPEVSLIGGLNPNHCMYNRELLFRWFLARESFEDEVYWFTEPDARVVRRFPALDDDVDVALLYRDDSVHITPSFRLARKSALPLFDFVLENYDHGKRDWHGDSEAFNRLWEDMRRPGMGKFFWNGLKVELRDWEDYNFPGSRYVEANKARRKLDLYADEQNHPKVARR